MEEFDDLLQQPDDSGYLDLSHRAWSTLDNVLWTWGQTLIVLNISYNNIKSISGGLGELSLLRELDARCNQIETLPEELGKCVRLKVLRINGNRLRKLPDNLGKCRMIEELFVSENQLIEVPPSIGSMSVLRIFKASNNKIEEVPPELCNCLALKELDLTGNNTRNLPSELQSNVAMALWLMGRELKQRTNVQQLEAATAELEDSARLQDEKRIELEDKIKALTSEYEKLEREMPHDYLRWRAKFEGCKSRTCAIQ
jgi:Leucine-rich repeat (LRR) protein